MACNHHRPLSSRLLPSEEESLLAQGPPLTGGSPYGMTCFRGVKRPCPLTSMGDNSVKPSSLQSTPETWLRPLRLHHSPLGPIPLPSLLPQGSMLRAVSNKPPAHKSPSQSWLSRDPTCDTRPGQPLVETVASDVGRSLEP